MTELSSMERLAIANAELVRVSRRLGEAEGILQVMANSYELSPSYFSKIARAFLESGKEDATEPLASIQAKVLSQGPGYQTTPKMRDMPND